MEYRNKCKNKKYGFTLIELLVALSVGFIMVAVSLNSFNSYKSHNNLAVAVNGVVEAVRLAQSSSQSGKGDSRWGVEILTNKVIVFKGNTYAVRDTSFDQPLSFSSGISTSGTSEIVFEKISGTTIGGTITLTNDGEIKNLIVNAKGTVTY